jgi:hypothetical protein
MINGLFYAHSGWRYIVFLLLALVILKSLIGMLGRGKWANLDDMLNRFTPIGIDIQFLLGLILWILQQRWSLPTPTESWEHPVTMLIATVLAHATSSRVKKAPTDAAKFQAATVGYIIVAIVVALGVARITEVI